MASSYFDYPSTKQFLDPMMEFYGITARLLSEMAAKNLKTMNLLMQDSAEQLQCLSGARGFHEIMNMPSRWAMSTAPHLCQHSQEMLDMMMEGASNYSKCLEKGFNFSQKDKTVKDY